MAKKAVKTVLAADIGGTKSWVGLFAASGGGVIPVREQRFVNAGYAGIWGVLSAFLRACGASRIDAAAFGIACPVVDNRGTLTNTNWEIDGDKLAAKLGVKRLTLINDLVAAGWGINGLMELDMVTLQEGVPRGGNAALIAAGTGLGEAMLYRDGSTLIPCASEGGHGDFAPRNSLEVELFSYLVKKYKHVSYERVLSGHGIENIYRFLRSRSGKKEPAYLAKTFRADNDAASVITAEAVKGDDSVCAAAIELFCSVYGAEAGNLALRSMAVSGVYVAGGIAPKILQLLRGGAFIRAFSDKGRFAGFLKQIPVRVILNDKTALYGAARCAAALSGC